MGFPHTPLIAVATKPPGSHVDSCGCIEVFNNVLKPPVQELLELEGFYFDA